MNTNKREMIGTYGPCLLFLNNQLCNAQLACTKSKNPETEAIKTSLQVLVFIWYIELEAKQRFQGFEAD